MPLRLLLLTKQEQEDAPCATMNATAMASLQPLSHGHGQAGDKDAEEEERLSGELRQVPDQVLQESLQRMQRGGGITARLPDGGEKCRLWLSAARSELARRRQGAGCSAPPPPPTTQAPPQPPRPHGRQGEPAVETPACPSKQHQQQQRDVHIIKPKLEPGDRREGSSAPAPNAAEDWETTPLSGDNPFFTAVMSRTHVQTPFQMCIPRRFQRHLPKACTAAVLLCRGKSWAASYRGDLKVKKLDAAWMDFAVDNRLKINDACVFELVTAAGGTGVGGEDQGVVFRVQILRGGLPEEFVSKGRTADEPIVIAD